MTNLASSLSHAAILDTSSKHHRQVKTSFKEVVHERPNLLQKPQVRLGISSNSICSNVDRTNNISCKNFLNYMNVFPFLLNMSCYAKYNFNINETTDFSKNGYMYPRH